MITYKIIVIFNLIFMELSFGNYNDNLIQDEFGKFKVKFNKVYASKLEEQYRYKIFKNNFIEIQNHNERFKMGDVSYELEVNKFSDLTDDEFSSKLTHDTADNLYEISEKKDAKFSSFSMKDIIELPKYKNWAREGYVTPVKDQGECDCCWAFSVTGVLESHYLIKTNKSIELSEQNLIDCTKEYGNSGCDGGGMRRSFRYIIKNKGISRADKYPYEEKDNNTCRFKKNTVGVRMKFYKVIKPGDEESMKYYVAKYGPLTVGVESSYNFKNYKKGIYNEPRCNDSINHAMIVVGYGTIKRQDFWILKNSWGKEWGWRGYMRMARNINNCAVGLEATLPFL